MTNRTRTFHVGRDVEHGVRLVHDVSIKLMDPTREAPSCGVRDDGTRACVQLVSRPSSTTSQSSREYILLEFDGATRFVSLTIGALENLRSNGELKKRFATATCP